MKELQGTTRATKEGAKAAREAAREQQRQAKEVEKARKAEIAAAEKARAAKEAAAKKQAAAELREAKRVSDYWTKAHTASTIARQRAEERLAAARQRVEAQATRVARQEAAKRVQIERDTAAKREKLLQENARRGRGLLGAATGGMLGGAGAALGTARSVGGIRNVQERIQAANEFRERLTIVGSQANLTDAERAGAEQKVVEASKATGKDILELVGVLETGQAQFNDLRFFADHLQEIATIARASGADAGEFARALGFTRQAFGLSGDEAMEAARLMVAAASKGSIEVKDFATSFAPVAGLFAQSTGLKGLEGVRQFLGTSQAAGTLGKTADETATLVERFIAAIGSVDVQRDLKAQTGINVKGMSPQAIIERLATSRKFSKQGVKEDIFKDIREQQAVTALIAARNRTAAGQEGAIDIGAVAGVSAQEGAALTQQTMDKLQTSGALAFDRQNASLQEDTLKKLGDYNAQLLTLNEMSGRLEKNFGTLSLWASSIAATGIGAAAGGALSGGLGGGASAMAGGGMLAKLGGAASKFGAAGLILGGGAAIAGAVYEAGIGEDLGNWISDLVNGKTPKQAAQGMGAPLTDVQGGAQLPEQVLRTVPEARLPTQATASGASERNGAELVTLQKKNNALIEQLTRVVAEKRPFVEASTRAAR